MFVNTRLLSPVILDGLTQAPEGSYEWVEWWEEQQRRCLNGYKVGDCEITGYHYFYLNFWRIRSEKEGRMGKVLQAPRFLDMDHEFFWEMQKAMEAGEDMLVLKARQRGFSYKSSCIGGYDFSLIPDSYTIISSGNEEFGQSTFRMIKNGLDGLVKTEFYKNRLPDKESYIQAAYKAVDEEGREAIEGYMGVVHRITATTPQANIGKSASKVIYEEGGKFIGIKQTKAYTDPGMEVGGRKVGFQLIIATGGEENESIEEIRDMIYDPHTYGLRSYDNTHAADVGEEMFMEGPRKRVAYFVPAWKFRIIDKEGNSLKEESIADIQRVRRLKGADKDAILKERTQNPLTIEEALMVPDGNVFDVARLYARLTEILQSEELQARTRKGNIHWTYNDRGEISGAEWEDNLIGPYIMTEPPVRTGMLPDGTGGQVPSDLYIAATDSYDRDKTASVNGSFGCIKVYKLFNRDLSDGTMELPVCSLTHRPETAKEFYEMTAKMCVLYGNAPNLVEYSNLLIFDWYQQNGFEHLLKERPMVAYAGVINSNVQNRYGVDPQVKPYAIQAAVDWVRENAHKLDDVQFIRRLIRYRRDPNYNCDETMAFAWLITHRNDFHARLGEAKADEEAESWSFRPRMTVRRGRIVRV